MALTKVHNRLIAQAAINVKDYGAVGDGVADDTTAVTAAIAAGGLIYFPSGTYRITSKITIASNKTLFGDGYASKIGYDTTGSSLFQITGSNVLLDRLRMQSLDTSSPKDVLKGLILVDEGIDNISITNCQIGYFKQLAGDDYGYCIYVVAENISNLHIDDNLFESAQGVDDNATGGDGTVGFIFFHQDDDTGFATGVDGTISRNKFYNTETIPDTTLRSDADAIRFYNKWVWDTDNYATSHKVNSYNIIISENVFELIQHLCIKASGVGGLVVTNNIVDNTQADRYPSTPNSFGTNGEKDFQIGFEFRGGSFVCDGNRITTQASSILANGVMGITGYSGIISNNIVEGMTNSRTDIAGIGIRQDNINVSGNTIDMPSASYENALSATFLNTYFPSSTKIINAHFDNNHVKNGGMILADVWYSNISDIRLDNGPLTTRRDNYCQYSGLHVENDEKPFVPYVTSGNAANNNRFLNCYFRAKSMTETTANRAFEVTVNMDYCQIYGLTVEVDAVTGTGTNCNIFSQSNSDMVKIDNLLLVFNGSDGSSYFRSYAQLYNDVHIGRMEVRVNDTSANNGIPIAEINSASSTVLIETIISRTITGNIDNYGTNTRVINLCGGFGVDDLSGGTHTVHNTTAL